MRSGVELRVNRRKLLGIPISIRVGEVNVARQPPRTPSVSAMLGSSICMWYKVAENPQAG